MFLNELKQVLRTCDGKTVGSSESESTNPYDESNTEDIENYVDVTSRRENKFVPAAPEYEEIEFSDSQSEYDFVSPSSDIFEHVKKVLIMHEKDYINKCLRVLEDPNFHVYVKNGLYKPICGLIGKLKRFHSGTFLEKLEYCEAHDPLASIFSAHKEELFLHVLSEWEVDKAYEYIYTEELKIHFDFYNTSANLMKYYITAFETLQKHPSVQTDYKFDLTLTMLKDVHEQIFFVKNGIKLITGKMITYDAVGLVYYMEKMKFAKFLSKKTVYVFFTERYVIITEMKDRNYAPLEYLRLAKAVLKLGPKFSLHIYTNNRKHFVLISHDEYSYRKVRAFVLKRQHAK